MTDPLRSLPQFGPEIGLDNQDNLRIAGTKIITNALGVERSIEPQADGSLKVNGAAFAGMVTGLTANSSSAAAVNTSAINAALSTGGLMHISGSPGTVYYINSTLVAYSDTRLVIDEGVTIKLANGSNCTMLTNASYNAIRHSDFYISRWTLQDQAGVAASMTSAGLPFSNLVTVTIANTDPFVGSISAGDWVLFPFCGTGGYGGVHQILSVTPSGGNILLTYQASQKPKATTCSKLTFQITGTTTNGSAVVTGCDQVQYPGLSPNLTCGGLQIGMAVTGTGIPASTTVASVQSLTSFTLSANATASGSVTITCTVNLQFWKADKNIRIEGGIWDYNAANNWNPLSGTPSPSPSSIVSSGFVLAGLYNCQLDRVKFTGTPTRCVSVSGVRRFSASRLTANPGTNSIPGSRNGQAYTYPASCFVGIQMTGPQHQTKVTACDFQRTLDDGYAILCTDSDQYIVGEPTKGDLCGILVEDCNAYSTVEALAIYAFKTTWYATQIHVRNFTATSDSQASTYGYFGTGIKLGGAAGVTPEIGSLDDVTLEGIAMSNLSGDIQASGCTIAALRILNVKFNREGYSSVSAGVPPIYFGVGGTFNNVLIQGLSFPTPYQSALGSSYVIQVDSTALIGELTVRDVATSYVTSAISYLVGLTGSGAIKAVNFENVRSEANQLIYISQAIGSLNLTNCVMTNAAQIAAKYVIDHNTGTVDIININGLRADQMYALYHPRGAGAVVTKFFAGAMSYTQSNQASISDAANGTLSPFSFTLPVDVGAANVAKTNGLMAYNVKAATTAGPAYANGTNWKSVIDGSTIV